MTLTCGVCGSTAAPLVRGPRVPGHEIVWRSTSEGTEVPQLLLHCPA